MKKKLIITIILFCFILITVGLKYYIGNYMLYKDYIEDTVNISVYNTCDSIIEMDAIISKILKQGYVLENEMVSLKDLYKFYIENFNNYGNLAKQLKDFDFYEIDNQHSFNYEYANFYQGIDNLFDDNNMFSSFDKYQLNDEQLELFNKSHVYTSSVVSIIKNNIDFYNMFDIEINEEVKEHNTIINITKVYRNEYLESWDGNSTGSGAKESINGSSTTSELSEYNYPEKKFINIGDNNWIKLLKEIKKLNIEIE